MLYTGPFPSTVNVRVMPVKLEKAVQVNVINISELAAPMDDLTTEI